MSSDIAGTQLKPVSLSSLFDFLFFSQGRGETTQAGRAENGLSRPLKMSPIQKSKS